MLKELDSMPGRHYTQLGMEADRLVVVGTGCLQIEQAGSWLKKVNDGGAGWWVNRLVAGFRRWMKTEQAGGRQSSLRQKQTRKQKLIRSQ